MLALMIAAAKKKQGCDGPSPAASRSAAPPD